MKIKISIKLYARGLFFKIADFFFARLFHDPGNFFDFDELFFIFHFRSLFDRRNFLRSRIDFSHTFQDFEFLFYHFLRAFYSIKIRVIFFLRWRFILINPFRNKNQNRDQDQPPHSHFQNLNLKKSSW